MLATLIDTPLSSILMFRLEGVCPTAPQGRRLQMDLFWWHSLWTFVIEQCSDLDGWDAEDWTRCRYHQGYLIDNDKAIRLADRLDQLLAEGVVRHRVDNWIHCGDADRPIPFSEETVEQFSRFVAASGGFRVY